MKDLFSGHSSQYAQFRPTYPAALYDFLLQEVSDTNRALDCATGNGQVARALADFFKEVDATDISFQQLEHAIPHPRITYRQSAAEKSDFPAHSFDLITVAQAIHWFDFDAFYAEVKRLLKPDGILAVIGYGIMRISPSIDELVHSLYQDILGDFWPEERKYIEDNYLNIPFPFHEITPPDLRLEVSWTLDQLKGYLATWSAFQQFLKVRKSNPMEFIEKELNEAWGQVSLRTVTYPLLIKTGRV